MTEFTPARLADLRAVAEQAEPMIVFGGPAQNTYVSVEKQELLALIAALEAKTAEVEAVQKQLIIRAQDSISRRLAMATVAEVGTETAAGDAADTLAELLIEAEAALERVKALHKPEPFYDEPSKQFCILCQITSGVWPCATIQAIQGAEG